MLILFLPCRSKYNKEHVDFNDENLDIFFIGEVNSIPAVGEHLTTNWYFDQTVFKNVDELSLLRLDPDEKLKLDEQDFKFINPFLTSPKTIVETPTKTYVESLSEKDRNWLDMSILFRDQDSEFDDNKFTDSDFLIVNRNPSSDNELGNKKMCMKN